MSLEQVKDIIKYHKSEKCFKCDALVEKGEDGTFKCPNCNFEWANLFIKRIPVNPFIVFKKFADSEFCSDYGMAFKNLIDDSFKMEGILAVIANHEEKISKLENKPPKEIRTLGGKLVRGGRENG